MSEYYVSLLINPDTGAEAKILTAGRTEQETYDSGRKKFPPNVVSEVIPTLLGTALCTEALYNEVTQYGATSTWAIDDWTDLLCTIEEAEHS